MLSDLLTTTAGLLHDFSPHFIGFLTLVMALAASMHVLLNKRDTRAATGWIGLIWLAPVLGAVLYLLFGINRIRRKAARLRKNASMLRFADCCEPAGEREILDAVGANHGRMFSLAKMTDRLTRRPLLSKNRIVPLLGGDQAYPAMIQAINKAERSITLASYIFANDRAGSEFKSALASAVRRGIRIRVLLDAVGARYSMPPITSSLQRAGVRVARFMPTYAPWRMPYMNLRNHRKIMVVDGRTGFTGGMNIDQNCLSDGDDRPKVRDLHFKVEGPVVAEMQEVFAEDWLCATGEQLSGESWFPQLRPAGNTVVRAIADGPDEDFDKLRWTLLGALECAERSVAVVTPYFLPDEALATALSVAAMTGIRVDIILPERSNLRLVQWASTPLLPELLSHRCRIWLTPAPFDHSKLMIVDSSWVLLGSGNWDSRSLTLNFEFDLECYGRDLAGELEKLIEDKRSSAKELRREDLLGRNLLVRLRDSAARLLSPYL
ncbi:MAG: cardiolipin synthase [Elusimicrobiota bacterium]